MGDSSFYLHRQAGYHEIDFGGLAGEELVGFAQQVAVDAAEPSCGHRPMPTSWGTMTKLALSLSTQAYSPAGMVLLLTFSNHSSGIDITFMCPQTTEEAPVQEIPIICYIQEVLGQPTLEVGHLDMLTHVLYSLKGIGKIRVTAQ